MKTPWGDDTFGSVAGFAVDSSSSKWTVDIPPTSASQPVANCAMCSGVLKVYRSLGAREGSSAPSIRRTMPYLRP